MTSDKDSLSATPILTIKLLSIGEHFIYENCVWVRTNTYAAFNITKEHSCYFGWKDDIGYEEGYHEEWSKFIKEAHKIENKNLSKLILENAKELK